MHGPETSNTTHAVPKGAAENTAEEALLPTRPSLSLDECRAALFDPRAVSDRNYPGGYAAAVAQAHEADQQKVTLQKQYDETVAALDNARQLQFSLADKISKVEQKLGAHAETRWSRFLAYLGARDRTALALTHELGGLQEEFASLSDHRSALSCQREQLGSRLRSALYFAEHLSRHDENILRSKLQPDEIRALASDNLVRDLNLEDFCRLWRRLDPSFLSHVTRVGVRDHCAMLYHSAGMGEYHDGLSEILRDGATIRPPFAVRDGLRTIDERSVRRYLAREVFQTAQSREEAHNLLLSSLNNTIAAAPLFPDKRAVHFAVEEVANDYYGAEQDNEAFFVFPSALLAARYPFGFNGREHTFARQSETKWNDLFVWAGEGVPTHLGILFLPKSTLVDRITGSRYHLEETEGPHGASLTPGKDTAFEARFRAWAQDLPTNLELMSEISASAEGCPDYQLSQGQRTVIRGALRTSLLEIGARFDVADSIAGHLIPPRGWLRLEHSTDWQSISIDADRTIAHLRLDLERTRDPITAEQYWTTFFSNNPLLRPARLTFYDGQPTAAVFRFQLEHGIDPELTHESASHGAHSRFGRLYPREPSTPLLGLQSNYVSNMHSDPRAMNGYDELLAIASRVISERFPAGAP